ncbi:hypothetical protein GCM10025857_21960 [Alicyclobacillus contaminans]|uniref:GDSL-type esterase/lipase family protein n=1 Tax=Alicyclobacillus contaminans TaxID=392016 RepID=UPI00041C95E5|nr:GDSL-type esterase/lipase family protein [Alicyclobacillus contaminans]GMA50839.1 hypothetical protein GCM10025857_21960 [Alicyclobacillus contaminans]
MRAKHRSPAVSERSLPKRATRRTHRWILGFSAAATALLAGCFFYGLYAGLGGRTGGGTPQAAPLSTSPAANPSAQKKTVHLVALGDSLAHGYGDASGMGFVGDVSQQFRRQGDSVIQSNLGIDGLTSSGLLTELQQPAVRRLLPAADIILVSIGGNDLNDAAGLPTLHTAQIAVAQRQFETNLTRILTQIQTINPTAPILLVGLYNPYQDIASVRVQTDTIVQDWDTREASIASKFPHTVVVQTFDLFALHGSSYLYVDHFHPNQAGYQRIADRIWQDLQGG